MIVRFETIVRRISGNYAPENVSTEAVHPFDERNIHSEFSGLVRRLFDNGHYTQATLEAFKMLDNYVKATSQSTESGHKMMMNVFSESNPKIQLTNLSNQSEIDEQIGYKFIFAGAISAIRNPRAHENLHDSIDLCLDHLSFASILLRRLEARVIR